MFFGCNGTATEPENGPGPAPRLLAEPLGQWQKMEWALLPGGVLAEKMSHVKTCFSLNVNGGYWMILGRYKKGHEDPFASGFVFFFLCREGRQSFDILWHIVPLLVYPLVVDPPKIRCFMACGTLVYWIGCPSSHRHLKNCFYTNGNRKWRNNCRLANIQPIEILIGFHFLSVLLSVGNSELWTQGVGVMAMRLGGAAQV